MTKRFGFTLAEVLITLGIIGVVAAMTMPTLINQTNGAQYKAAFKKALSVISQGVTLNVALDDKSFADGATYDIIKDRMNIVSETMPTGYSPTGTTPTLATAKYVIFNDSSMFVFDSTKTSCTSTAKCDGYIDVNGAKGPNKVTTDATKPLDIYIVKYYDQTIEPADDAAKGVLYN